MTQPHAFSDTDLAAAARAADDLRRRMGFTLTENGRAVSYYPIESLDENTLARLPAARTAVLAGSRARHLKPAADAAAAAVTVDAAGWSAEQLHCLADPLAAKADHPAPALSPAGEADRMALALAKRASLLPALLKVEDVATEGQAVELEALRAYLSAPADEVEETARARLPLEGAEDAVIVSFRAPHEAAGHLALVVGKAGGDPLVRVHSSCVTGDILGSLRCDCGSQLQLALKAIVAEGAGALLYLHQEGRGIGIANKLKAYALQERGVDTYEANLMLGFEEDERDFSIAAAILKKLGIEKCRLLTNNPVKAESLGRHGIAVSGRVPLPVAPGRHNHAYLKAKTEKFAAIKNVTKP